MQAEASAAQEAQQSSNDYKGYLESLRDEVGKLKSAVESTAGVSQELSVCGPSMREPCLPCALERVRVASACTLLVRARC